MMLSRNELANVVRILSMDAIERASSGHPGAPMGMADIAEVLWNDFLKHNPSNPNWDNRDRFVMSNGHASMLLYSLLHLSGYELSIDDIKNFRQLHSKTPGHPEYGCTPGIDTTTGPLGQGIANAVGMSLAEAILAATYNRDNFNIVDHFTFATVGDGCLMEGVSHEACSLAGTLRLGKLIVLYDDNNISIDGEVDGWFTEDIPARFKSYNWHVIDNVDGHNPEDIKEALTQATSNKNSPSLICCKTTIGKGSPNKAGKEICHGAPLGKEEIKLVRDSLGWKSEPFDISNEYYEAWSAKERGQEAEEKWQQLFLDYKKIYPELAKEYKRRMQGLLPIDWELIVDSYIKSTIDKAETCATRKASQKAINAYAEYMPELIGGSADLTASNLTNWTGSVAVTEKNKKGNYIYYGVREFAMVAVNNGVSLHGGFIPYGGTFLIFSEYARNALRMAALMKIRNIFVFTHDSIGLGEDGPTHQAVEQAATLRLMPNMSLWRPCDTVESAVAWQAAIERVQGPTSLLFSRQNLTYIERSTEQIADIKRGAYILLEGSKVPDVIIIATGSEVEMSLNAAIKLNKEGKKVRVVSMPNTNVFDEQDDIYKEHVLPGICRKRVAVEAGSTDFWKKYTGLDGRELGVDSFGDSAPAKEIFEQFGLTEKNIIKVVDDLISV